MAWLLLVGSGQGGSKKISGDETGASWAGSDLEPVFFGKRGRGGDEGEGKKHNRVEVRKV